MSGECLRKNEYVLLNKYVLPNSVHNLKNGAPIIKMKHIRQRWNKYISGREKSSTHKNHGSNCDIKIWVIIGNSQDEEEHIVF